MTVTGEATQPRTAVTQRLRPVVHHITTSTAAAVVNEPAWRPVVRDQHWLTHD